MAASSPPGGSLRAHPHRDGQRERDRPIATALGLPSEHVVLIEQSHERCAALGLSRIERPDFSPLGRADLNVARERNQRLQSHAAPVMEMLHDQIINSGNMVVLCDASGTVIHSVGDDEFLERAAKVALAPGVNWSEASKGTNGIGTALIEERPTLVHADEHFLHANQFLTCSSTPIIDPRGNVLGVLDVSGDQRSYHPHTMALVKMSARMIENQWLQDHCRESMRLHFHYRLGHVGSLVEGIIAVAPDGKVLGANRSALELLNISNSAVRQRNLMSLFGVPVSLLADHFRSPMAAPLQLRTDDDQPFFVHARFDWPVWSRVAEAAALPPASPRLAHTADECLSPRRPDLMVVQPSDCNPARPGAPGLQAAAAARHASSGVTPSAAASKGMQALRTGDAHIESLVTRLRAVLDRQLPILLHGECGTGKQLWSRAWHADSAQHDKPLWLINCATLSRGCLDAEFDRQRLAHGGALPGTLVLTNLDDLPAPAQAQLLRLLQSFDDGDDGLPAWAGGAPGLVSSTQLNPQELKESGRLRADLFYRLNGLSVRVPSLRERSDLAQLTRSLLADKLHAPRLSVSTEAMELLQRHTWPGNVRELYNVLRVASAMAGTASSIRTEHLPEEFLQAVRRQPLQEASQGRSGAAWIQVPASSAPAAEADCAGPDSIRNGAAATGGDRRPLHEVERQAIERAVEAAGGNLSLAAKQLGVSRNTIYRRLRWNERSSC